MTPDEACAAVESGVTVVARYSDGTVAGEGRAIVYSIVPTVTIAQLDGSCLTWRHDMVDLKQYVCIDPEHEGDGTPALPNRSIQLCQYHWDDYKTWVDAGRPRRTT